MGIAVADFDGDGDSDLFMTHLNGETNTLFENDGAGLFVDSTTVSRLAAPSLAFTGFGTAALEQPEVVADACRRFPGRIAVGIDARRGKVAIKGWLETSAVEAGELAHSAEQMGAACIIYTDIDRDGTQHGVNVEATRALAESVHIPVIASGGVGSLADVEALLPHESAGIAGVIIGRALYTGAVALEDAIRVCRKKDVSDVD